jgi:hypothetical protein
MYRYDMANKDSYSTADDLAAFTNSELEDRNLPSPGTERLTDLFRIAYAASMATEEGQPITFEITWIDPENPDPDPPKRILADRWTTVPFTSRLILDTRALVKAAKATDPRTSAFAAYASKDETPFIWGLVDQGNRVHAFTRFDSRSGPSRAGMFQVSAIGVGHLVVSIRYETVAELRVDRLSLRRTDPLRFGPISEALRLGYESYISSVRAEIEPAVYEQRFHWDSSLRLQWLESVARILLRIRDMRHGGAILITPDTSTEDLEIKYAIEYPRLGQALQRWGTATIRETHAEDLIHEAMDTDESTISMGIYLEESVAEAQRVDVESEIDGTLWFIACLSRVDGLVLMGLDLSIYGFGAVITAENPPTSLRAAIDNQATPAQLISLSYDQFGTRHRSMMRYCNAHSGSVGFVVSQDGDIRCMTKVGENLVVWDNVRVERRLASRIKRKSSKKR